MLHRADLTWLTHRKEARLMHSAPTAAARLAKVYQQSHSNDRPQLCLHSSRCPPPLQEPDQLPWKHADSVFPLRERPTEKKEKVEQLKRQITRVVEPSPDSSHCDCIFKATFIFFLLNPQLVLLLLLLATVGKEFFVCGSKGLAASKAHQQLEIFHCL